MRILLIEDNPQLCVTISEYLAAEGFAIDFVHEGPVGEEMGLDPHYAAAILDLGLPGCSGLQVLINWRRAGISLPVIILTARNSWRERIEGIEAGADDYLGKPFHVQELVSRLRALLRRSYTKTQGKLKVGTLTLDESLRQAIIAPDHVISLTATEFKLLRCLMLNRNQVLSKETIFFHLYTVDADLDLDVIETHVMRLRKKIGEEWVRTVRGHGYQLQIPEQKR
ncbi:MAG: response regulator transcription factor [Magnetococcales bacterium]|nr:response regulator transcription factor [Magnetococcales bacterium]MBF0437488.1 response regulator transcription factor [Magnetococcales bacterium]